MKSQPLIAPSNERIEWFNNVYRITLPDDYVHFLKEHNGEIPKRNVFFIGRREYVVERFLCMLNKPSSDENGWYDITIVITELGERLTDNGDLIGMNVIPIAALFAGDFVCLDYRKSKEPKVIIWYHEESDDFKPVTQNVADSFTEFLSMLK